MNKDLNEMTMKKKNYTGPVTEFVDLKPLYNLCQNMGVGSDRFDTGEEPEDPDDTGQLSNEHIGGSWDNIWGAQ